VLAWLRIAAICRTAQTEAVAYVVCKSIGLECSTRASEYIQLWKGAEKTLRQSLETIRSFAAGILPLRELGQQRKNAASPTRSQTSAFLVTSWHMPIKRRARDSNPQPLTGHFISNEAANHSLTLQGGSSQNDNGDSRFRTEQEFVRVGYIFSVYVTIWISSTGNRPDYTHFPPM
jgi:hypothetical protein